MPGLLVSVRSGAEAEAARAGGADIIDVKEPSRGPLGRADDAVAAEVVRVMAGRRPVSAALGELGRDSEPLLQVTAGLSFVKWGLAGRGSDWSEVRRQVRGVSSHIGQNKPACRLVLAAYADWERAESPTPEAVLKLASEAECGAFLLDTFGKDGTTLLDWLPFPRLADLCRSCRNAGLRLALAGSLGERQFAELRTLQPTWFAVRGAACRDGQRAGPIDLARVQRLVRVLAEPGG